ncbi:AraC family transcriptional regulator [Kitasatospora sp. NBC_00458]|uniref:AraC family transcriptional regulator n=1 Tax=Kitasatospora sp. NBC_00458 TaxID=2903568 RepID=UPI002E19DDAC
MDIISDAVSAMRTGTPHSSVTELRAPWGIRFDPQQGAGFHVITEGTCWLIPAGGEPVRLVEGDVAFLPRELGHAIADTPTTPLSGPGPRETVGTGRTTRMLCGAYRLDHARAHPLLAELPDLVHLPGDDRQSPELRGAVDLLRRELATGQRAGAPGVLTALLDVLLLYVLRAWHERQAEQHTTGWGAALHDPALAAALRAVHREPAAPWTVQSLADRAGLSRTAFAQRFTATIGRPPLGYLTWWRMTLAARSLRETDLLLRTVAEQVGYTTEYAFARAFKREFHTAPGRYRATHRTPAS